MLRGLFEYSAPRGQRIHFRCFRLRVVCEECGDSCPVNEPALETVCRICGATVKLPVDYLREHVLGAATGRTLPLSPGQEWPLYFLGAGVQLSGVVSLLWPRCPGCDEPMNLEAVRPGAQGLAPCARCGVGLATYPPPPWLAQMNPFALQVLVPRPPEVNTNARPIALACPECGGNLRVDHQSKRLVSCRYCTTDVFLPAEVWAAFHPVRKRASWYVAFDG